MDVDEEIGRNIRALREAGGHSQADVATRLSARLGVTIYPQTITKIEAGKRALKFVEGLHLAAVLGVKPWDLYRPGPSVAADAQATRRIAQVRDSYLTFSQAFRSYTLAKAALEEMLLGEPGHLSSQVTERAAEVAAGYLPVEVEDSLDAAMRDWNQAETQDWFEKHPEAKELFTHLSGRDVQALGDEQQHQA